LAVGDNWTMRFPLSLSGLFVLCLACGAPAPEELAELENAETPAELVVLRQEITAGSVAERFTDSLEPGEIAARGPFAIEPGEKLQITLAGRGDGDLYVRFNSRPTTSTYDCRPYTLHSNEQCVLTAPAGAKSVYVDIHASTTLPKYSLVMESVRPDSVGGGSTPGKPFVIAVLGSSTAEGEGASSLNKSWVRLLASQLSSIANVSIVNFATGGYSTLDLLPATGAGGTVDDAIAEHPDLIVVSLAGGNDISSGTPAASYVPRLTEASRRAKAAGIPAFFVGTAPKNADDADRQQLGSWNQEMRSRFSTCWTPGNASYSPCFIDVMPELGNADHEIKSTYDSGDGIHLNDAGHDVLFQNAAEVITQYVCSKTDCR
jgi:lysophospholipase L1-like esterase